MIVVVALLLAWGVLLVAALRLNMAVTHAAERFRVITGGYGDAELLARTRQRFRQRQRAVERALDTGTAGLETAHRSFARHLGTEEVGMNVYDRLRGLNRGFGRALSGVFAPRPRQRSKSLAEWRASQPSTLDRPADDDRDD